MPMIFADAFFHGFTASFSTAATIYAHMAPREGAGRARHYFAHVAGHARYAAEQRVLERSSRDGADVEVSIIDITTPIIFAASLLS